MDNKKSLLLVLVVSSFVSVGHAVDFYTVDAITSSTEVTDLLPASNLIQGVDVGYDGSEPHDQLGGLFTHRWATTAPGGFPADYFEVADSPVLTIDLGVDQILSEISVWGYTTANANGVSEFSLRFATDAEGTSGFGTSILFNPVFNPIIDDVSRQSFSFGESLVARYVELTALDNFYVSPGDGSGGEIPGGDRVGLGEIAFEVTDLVIVATPEPMTATLAGMALVVLAATSKRRVAS